MLGALWGSILTIWGSPGGLWDEILTIFGPPGGLRGPKFAIWGCNISMFREKRRATATWSRPAEIFGSKYRFLSTPIPFLKQKLWKIRPSTYPGRSPLPPTEKLWPRGAALRGPGPGLGASSDRTGSKLENHRFPSRNVMILKVPQGPRGTQNCPKRSLEGLGGINTVFLAPQLDF